MSEIRAYQKIVFPDENMKNWFLREKPSRVDVSNLFIEYLSEHSNIDSCAQYILYIGGDYDDLRFFWEELINKFDVTVFSLYIEDHTGECIFNIESKDVSLIFEEHEDFDFPDDKDYRFNLVDALDYLVSKNLPTNEMHQDQSVELMQYPVGSLPPKQKFIKCNDDISSKDVADIYLLDRQFVQFELLCDKLRLKGWKYIAVFDSKKVRKGSIYCPVIVASKYHNPEMEELLNRKNTPGYSDIINIHHNGIAFFYIYENYSVIEYLTNEFGEEGAQEYFENCSAEVQAVLSMSNCQISMATSTSDISLSLGLDLYDAIGSLTTAIECDWDLNDFCII